MNFVTYQDERLNLSTKSIQQIEELKSHSKRIGVTFLDPSTDLPVHLVCPSFQDGHRIRVAHARYPRNAEKIQLQDEYLYDPDRMVQTLADEEQETSQEYDPRSYYLRAQVGENHAQTASHYYGNLHLADDANTNTNYKSILDRIGWTHLLESGCSVEGEYRLAIPSQRNRYRIIDNAVLDSTGQIKVAIEYQCSPISSNALEQRIEDYIAADIHQVWILGGKCEHNSEMKSVLNVHGINHFSWNYSAKYV